MSLPLPTTPAQEIYQDLRSRGVTLWRGESGNLKFKPKSLVRDEDIEALKRHKPELLQIISNLAGDGISSPASPRPLDAKNADNYGDSGEAYRGTASDKRRPPIPNAVPPSILEARNRRRERASELGLVAKWSNHFGYISVHDPETGEWHDLPMKEAPDWARSEAFRRKDLKKAGKEWMITRSDMEEMITQEQRYSGFRTKAQTAGGLVYEDYIDDPEGGGA